jgi:DNA-binding NarL/FixJ family response regulator
MIRVEIRSPSPFAQAGLQNAISADSRFEIVAGHGSDSDHPDVILVDGFDAEIATVPASTPKTQSTRFVLLTDGVAPSEFARLTQLGVRAILPRDSSTQEITAALEAASEDLTVIAPGFLPELLPAGPTERVETGDYLQEPLTAREREVLTLLAEGAENKEIAARLKISDNTAKFHVSSILGKLGATTRTEAVTRGYRLGLIFI